MHILVFMQNRGRGNRRGNRRCNWRGQSIAKQNRIHIFCCCRLFSHLLSFLTFSNQPILYDWPLSTPPVNITKPEVF